MAMAADMIMKEELMKTLFPLLQIYYDRSN
jgi:hypothetical protein